METNYFDIGENCGELFEDSDGIWKNCILPRHSSNGHVGLDCDVVVSDDDSDTWIEDLLYDPYVTSTSEADFDSYGDIHDA